MIIGPSARVFTRLQDDLAQRIKFLAADIMLTTTKNLQTIIGLRDGHTTRKLKKLGHPYSVKRPKDNLHPDYLVHIQSAQLISSIRNKITEKRNQTTVSVWIDPRKAPHVADLIHGTSRMRPRPFLFYAMKLTKEELPALVDKHIIKGGK